MSDDEMTRTPRPGSSMLTISAEAATEAAWMLERRSMEDARLNEHDKALAELAFVHGLKKWAIASIGSAFAALGVAIKLAYGIGVSSTAATAARDKEITELRYRLQAAEQTLADLRALLPVRIVLPPTQSTGGTAP